MTGHMQQVRSWARRYYDMNLNPLPSCGHAKKPDLKGGRICRYRDRDRIPEDWMRRWWAPNIQIPLGVRWGLCVVDIDGSAADEYWDRHLNFGRCLDCWISGATTRYPDNSLSLQNCHLWFRLPDWLGAFPTTVLWSAGKGSEIKVLGDRALVVAPPSIHPVRKTPYEWLVGPDQHDRTSVIPPWLLSKMAEVREVARPAPSPRPQHRPLPSGPNGFGRHYQRDEVLYALGDRKHEIAARYGLEHRRHPNLAGFYDCRAVDRDDNDWSCTIDPRTGVYKDFATGKTLSFFDVLMVLDPSEFPSYPETVDRLGSYCFGAPIRE